MKKISIFLTSLLINLSVSAYDNFFVFGDSLSDVGNMANTQTLNDAGRWSNGAVWCEHLAAKLNVATATKSKDYAENEGINAGNINFAYGGGMTSYGTTSVTGILSLNEQIVGEKNALGGIKDVSVSFDRYKQNFGDNDLVSIWGGANNLFFSKSTIIDKEFDKAGEKAALDMIVNIQLLVDRGAKNLLILNLPDIGATPCYKDDAKAAADASLFSTTFNQVLLSKFEILKSANAGVEFLYVDMYAIFNGILANPSIYGFDVVDSELISAYNADNSVDQSKYLFYDDVHPTTAGHEALAGIIYSQIIPEPSDIAALFAVLSLFFVAYRKISKRTA